MSTFAMLLPCRRRSEIQDNADLRARLTQAQNAIVALEQERDLYKSRWLSCVTAEEAQRLRDRLAEADAVIAHAMFDEGRETKDLLRWADEALERYRDRKQEREDNSQFGVGA